MSTLPEKWWIKQVKVYFHAAIIMVSTLSEAKVRFNLSANGITIKRGSCSEGSCNTLLYYKWQRNYFTYSPQSWFAYMQEMHEMVIIFSVLLMWINIRTILI
jgi:hypothetical protein